MDKVQLTQGYKEPLRDSLLLITKSPEVFGAQFIDLGGMKG